MFRLFASFTCLFLASCTALADESFVRVSIKDVFLPSGAYATSNRNVRICGTVTWVRMSRIAVFAVQDETDSCLIMNIKKFDVHVGDTVSADCFIAYGDDNAYIQAVDLRILGHRQMPPPAIATHEGVRNGRFNHRPVALSGIVTDIFQDEIDVNVCWAMLSDGSLRTAVAIPLRANTIEQLSHLIDAEVSLAGCCVPTTYSGCRRFLPPHIDVSDLSDISVTRPPPDDPFNVPTLEFGRYLPPKMPAHRHKFTGVVVAAYRNDHMIVECAGNHRLEVRLLQDGALPPLGSEVIVSGFPECNAFFARFTRASVRITGNASPPKQSPPPLELKDLRTFSNGDTAFEPLSYGREIRIRGVIRNISALPEAERLLHIESEGRLICVELPHHFRLPPKFAVGCTAEITGIYVMHTTDDAYSGFSRISGFTVVPRSPEDFRLIKALPWLTPGKLLLVIGILCASLFIVFAWNISLRRISTRKSRALFREQLGHVKADLRTEERTRLAVELHDTLAQNLTGVSMEIEAANDLRGNAPKPMLDHLGIAAKALKSCRDELRNCLWDLRSQALEETDMTKAVLKTLQPVVNDSRLAVRFNVPRAQLSDNTAHALLRVIRELVINAIRHGNATTVKIAGTINNGKLLCSVTDNGCGFDPDSAPGVLQGHFGLQGIQERINEIGGTFEISSAPGKRTKATISIEIPRES